MKKSAKKFHLCPIMLVSMCWLQLQSPLSVAGNQIAQPKMEWVLHQEGDNGKLLIYIAPHAIKVVDQGRGSVLVTKAPDWQVHYFRPDTKVIWSGRPEEFDIRYVMIPTVLREPKDPEKVLSESKANDATISKIVRRVDRGKFERLSYESFAYTLGVNRFYMRTTNDISVDPQGARFLATMVGTFANGGVPLYFRRYRAVARSAPNNHKTEKSAVDFSAPFQLTDARLGGVEILVTKKCETIPYKPNNFEVPSDYKQVKNLSEVAFSNSMKEDLMESGLEFIEKSGNKRKN